MIKNPPAGDAGDTASILRLGRSPGEEMATHASILAWRIPWTEEPGGPRVAHYRVAKSQTRLSD